MKLARAAATKLETLADRAFCVLGAIVFSQAPEFMRQYLQRLGGHLDEARRILAQFKQAAAEAGASLPDYTAKLSGSDDSLIAALGGKLAGVAARADALAGSEEALRTASLFKRPFVFIANLDVEIAWGALKAYRPAVPATVEGAVYAALGLCAAYAAYHLFFRWPLKALLRRRRAKKEAARNPFARVGGGKPPPSVPGTPADKLPSDKLPAPAAPADKLPPPDKLPPV
ncbi:MAG: DUF2937 family protein [Opitutaceae bacterium]|jgi:hypothetical protein|nr:DUF2937 family protein [Opitutaceae bacterium]